MKKLLKIILFVDKGVIKAAESFFNRNRDPNRNLNLNPKSEAELMATNTKAKVIRQKAEVKPAR